MFKAALKLGCVLFCLKTTSSVLELVLDRNSALHPTSKAKVTRIMPLLSPDLE